MATTVKPVAPFIMMRGAKEHLGFSAPGIAQAIEKFMQESGKAQLQFVTSEEGWSNNTVEDLKPHLHCPLQIGKDPNLNPQNMGTCPHRKDRKKTLEHTTYNSQKQNRAAQFELPPGPGAESKRQLYSRVSKCVATNVAGGDTLVVFVTHDKPLNAYFKGLNLAKIFTDSTQKSFLHGRPGHGELFMVKKIDGKFIALERKA